MIPEAAVDAAAKALYPEVREEWRVPPDPWESIPEDDDAKIEAIALARLALQAAAPHMQPINEGTSMTEHEELLDVLLAADDAHKAEGAMWPELATAILAAGYRKTTK